jgi:hypothetical protein
MRNVGQNNYRVLAHRGLWNDSRTQNSIDAISAALDLGFGIEIDVRERSGVLVLSHDFPNEDVAELQPKHPVWDKLTEQTSIAFNIKADGLASELKRCLNELPKHNGFTFDMSLPEAVVYSSLNIPRAQRVSEYEPINLWRAAPHGVVDRIWLDCFHSDWWINVKDFPESLKKNQVFVVSPELHGRNPQKVWDWCKQELQQGVDIYICTDYPEKVAEQWS